MITSRLRLHLTRLLLGVVFSALSISTIAWTVRDKTPPAWDPSDHLRYAYDYFRLLAHGDFGGFGNEFFTAHHYYAPLVHLASALVFLVTGASRVTGLIVNLISLAGMLWAVSTISRELFAQNPENQKQLESLAVLPALIACCYHFSAWLLHDAFLDYPLTAAVAVTFAFLIKAKDFRQTRDALLFAVFAGCGLLVKQTFAFFFILPGLYIAIRVLSTRDRRAIANLVIACVVMALIAAVWYAPHLRDIIAIYRENQQAAISENEAPLYTFDSNFFYIHALFSMQMQVPFAVLFVGGVIYSLIRCPKRSVILYLWILSGLATFALVANKDVRYTVPVLPATAILSACWLREFDPSQFVNRSRSIAVRSARIMKPVLAATIVVWSLVSFFNAQWPGSGFGKAIDTPRYRWMVFARNYYGFDHRPLAQDWAVPEIVHKISDLQINDQNKDRPPNGIATNSSPVLGVVVNLPYLNPSSVALYSRLLSPERAGAPLIDVRWVVETSMIGRLEECDYVLVRTGLDKAEWVSKAEREVAYLIRNSPDSFREEASFPIPLDDASAVIYRRRTNSQ